MSNEIMQQEGATGRDVQFSVGKVYRMPFRERRVFDTETGRARYVPLEQEAAATGVAVMDEWLRWVGAGAVGGVEAFCKQVGVERADLDGFMRVMSGMSCAEFMSAYALRMADDLLCYTSLHIAEVASRCGFGSERNVYRVFLARYGCTPRERRLQLRQPSDVGRYRL